MELEMLKQNLEYMRQTKNLWRQEAYKLYEELKQAKSQIKKLEGMNGNHREQSVATKSKTSG